MGFGDFKTFCEQSAVPLCSVVGPPGIAGHTGIEPACYARNIEMANTIIFQAATSFMHILALIMTAIMIIHVRSKFTAVGKSRVALPVGDEV
jgi:Chitin synthase export chaperone